MFDADQVKKQSLNSFQLQAVLVVKEFVMLILFYVYNEKLKLIVFKLGLFYHLKFRMDFITFLILFIVFLQFLSSQTQSKTLSNKQKMSKSSFEVQQMIRNLKQEINDVLHLASLNNQSIICLVSNQTIQSKQVQTPSNNEIISLQLNKNLQVPSSKQNIFLKNHLEFQDKFKIISILFQKRTENHLNYLIVKQIQGEEQSVRRDRLSEYEQKIYDQRRLLSDKQVFLQSLYRPKKQRPQFMSSEQFQQIRGKQRFQEQKFKLSTLEEEIKKLTFFRKRLNQVDFRNSTTIVPDSSIIKQQIQLSNKMKNDDLQKTKSSSIEAINLSAFNTTLVEKLQKTGEQTQLNTILNTDSQLGSIQKAQTQKDNLQPISYLDNKPEYFSENTIGKQNKNTNSSIQIQKLIDTYEKISVPKEAKQKLIKIKSILHKIELKREQNSNKNKQLKELKKQNSHMSIHLKKIKDSYIANNKTINEDFINYNK